MGVAAGMLATALGMLIGLSLGAIGGGGSILTIPILVYVLGVDVHAATGTSLVIVGANAAFGALVHGRAGRVLWGQGGLFGLLGTGGALGGGWLNHVLPGHAVLAGLAALMLVAAWRMWAQRGTSLRARGRQSWWKVAGAGSVVGFMTGFFGVGGGFVIVPALVLVLGVGMTYAVGTSLLVIAINCATGLIPYIRSGSLDLGLAALMVVGGVAGIYAGAHIAGRSRDQRLREAFAVVVVLLAVYLLYRQAAVVLA